VRLARGHRGMNVGRGRAELELMSRDSGTLRSGSSMSPTRPLDSPRGPAASRPPAHAIKRVGSVGPADAGLLPIAAPSRSHQARMVISARYATPRTSDLRRLLRHPVR
jgi:hypothetical protein